MTFDALMRKLKFRSVTELVFPRLGLEAKSCVLSAPNSTCHSKETRNQEIYINNLRTGELSRSSAGPWERGTEDLESLDNNP